MRAVNFSQGALRRRFMVLSAVLAGCGWAATPASAEVLGAVVVSPLSGTDSTLFGGVVRGANCPAGTSDSFFDVVGSDIGVGAPRGMGEIGALGQASQAGRGDETFRGASIANLRTVGAGAFAASGRYTIRLRCERGAVTTDTYEIVMTYTAGGAGSFTVPAPPRTPALVAPSASAGLDTRAPDPSPGEAATTPGSGGATTPAPSGSPATKASGAATSASASAAGSPGAFPAGSSLANAGTPAPPAGSETATGSSGWLVLAAIGFGGALVLAARKRGWRSVLPLGTRPAVPTGRRP